jgi:hypothetical protein
MENFSLVLKYTTNKHQRHQVHLRSIEVRKFFSIKSWSFVDTINIELSQRMEQYSNSVYETRKNFALLDWNNREKRECSFKQMEKKLDQQHLSLLFESEQSNQQSS